MKQRMHQGETSMPIAHLNLQGNFTVDADGGTFLEDSRVRLLEAIDEFGSITKAARQVPLSYKTAWDAVNAMTTMAGQPLVVRTVGGAGGGGSCLTDYGRRLVAFYRALESEYQTALAELASHVGEPNARSNFRYLLRRQSMRSSARHLLPLRQNEYSNLSDLT
jgi:molybdate transport system regulatory protein